MLQAIAILTPTLIALILLMILFVGGVGPEGLKAITDTTKMEIRDWISIAALFVVAGIGYFSAKHGANPDNSPRVTI